MIWKFPFYEINSKPDWPRLEARFAWLRDMEEVPQDPIWHGEGNVLIHTKMVVEELIQLPEFQTLSEQDKHILVASALLHDVEKRSTTETQMIEGKERIVAPNHAKKGEFTARTLLYTEIPTPFFIREQITKLVRLHGIPLWSIEKEDPRKSVIRTSLDVNTKLLAMLAKADVLGRICPDTEELLLKIDLFQALCLEHHCWDKARAFPSNYGRYLYLNKEDNSPDYEPYNDLKFEVYMMCALPGSGKDTYIQKNFDLPIVSLDDIRREHKIDPKDSKKNGQVIQLGKEMARVLMRKRQSFVFNATNISSSLRNQWTSLFVEYGGRVKIIYVEVPYKQLLAQNHNRAYKVPESVIHRLIKKLELPGYHEAHEIEWQVSS